MSTLETRVAKLEARTGGDERCSGPIVFREGETEAQTLARLGLTSEDIEGPGPVIWLPETEGVNGDEPEAES